MDNIQLVSHGPAVDALGLIHRVRVPAGPGPHPTLIMLHGLEGNEDVTWIFARQAGPQWLIVSPRAPFTANDGHSWLHQRDYRDLAAYPDGLTALSRFIDGLPGQYPVDPARRVMLGFSQGAAMSYAFAAANSVQGIVAMAGFVPPLADESLASFAGLPILILHGTQDQRISIETAHQDRDRLSKAGANVTYVEDVVGHKVGSNGIHALKDWLAERLKG